MADQSLIAHMQLEIDRLNEKNHELWKELGAECDELAAALRDAVGYVEAYDDRRYSPSESDDAAQAALLAHIHKLLAKYASVDRSSSGE